MLNRWIGLLRSVAMYHAIPGRAARLRAFYRPFVPAGGLAFDVGAHAGNRVRAFRQLGARVIAVEPQPDFVRLLGWLYGRDPLVTVVPGALGRAPGEATLLASVRTPTVSTLSADWARQAGASDSFRGVRWQTGPRVGVQTLDQLIARHGRPDFVKIDVEGFELEVLQGLSQPLPALSFEFLAPLRELALGCVERLEALGRYRYAVSIGERLHWLDAPAGDAATLRRWLAALPDDAPSGDVYARLLEP